MGEPTVYESIMDMQLWPSQDLIEVGLMAALVGGSTPSVGGKEDGDTGDITVC
jgi:hypothetical protein